MKKITLAILLLLCTVAAHGQFVVSMYFNGSRPTFSNTTDYSTDYRTYNYEYIRVGPGGEEIGPFTGYTDSISTDQSQYEADNYIAVGGGLKIGYQLQRVQFGVAGTFNWHYTYADQSPTRYMGNNINCDVNVLKRQALFPDSMFLEDYVGQFEEQYTSFTVAPYVRVELVQSGDVALFVEANGFFTKVNKPTHHDYLDWYYHEMHSTIDTSFIVDRTTTSFGGLLVPGLSWQLSPHCLVDLYFDMLAIGYRYTKTVQVDVVDEYDYTASPRVLARRTTTTTTIEDTNIGFDLNAAPSAARNLSTFVRFGLSYTF